MKISLRSVLRVAACALVLLGVPCQAAPVAYKNPILSGFHADPSICRVGGDYYLVTSSFEYFPGVPIYHSKDLLHWRQIGNVLTRESQLPLKGQKSSKGIFAPTLRCHDGEFYMVTTNIEGGGNFFVHTRDPAGPWSEPVWLDEKTWGMDPSLLFDDDGKVYFTRHGGGRNGGVYQAEINLATGKLAEEPRLIWPGTGGIWPEGPHLYKINGMYYLMISEGGTSYEHSLTIARAMSPWGPFEAYGGNPLLTHRYHPELPLQATGHADLVQAENGSWWMVLLGVRPLDHHHHLGRETLLSPVSWNAQGWPVVNQGQPLQIDMQAEGLPPAAPWLAAPVRTTFNTPQLGPEWAHLRGPATDLWSLSERPGMLRLKGSAATLDDDATPAFVARRQEHFHMQAGTRMDFTPTAVGQFAGLVLRQNEGHYYALRVTGTGQRRVELASRVGGVTTIFKSLPIKAGPVTLMVTGWPDRYEFSITVGDGIVRNATTMGSAPTKSLSSETSGGFTGVFIGLFASGAQAGTMPPADFSWFDYIGLAN